MTKINNNQKGFNNIQIIGDVYLQDPVFNETTSRRKTLKSFLKN